MRTGLAEDQSVARYQTKVDLDVGEVHVAEVPVRRERLTRWLLNPLRSSGLSRQADWCPIADLEHADMA